MHIWFWIAFNAVILLLLVLDLTVVSRKHRRVPFKQALLMSAFWIGLAMAFAVFVQQWLGAAKALEFVTGYVLTLKFHLKKKRPSCSGGSSGP